jgi:hypothetical protein
LLAVDLDWDRVLRELARSLFACHHRAFNMLIPCADATWLPLTICLAFPDPVKKDSFLPSARSCQFRFLC